MRGASSSTTTTTITLRMAMLMRLFLGLVFLGWMVIWVMRPTNTYRRKWLPKILTATKSTYFGRQGTVMWIYTFPIMFIAVIGCFLLHVKGKSGHVDDGKSSRRWEAWKKPVIVKGPLGIITATELAFCLMFIAMIVWALFVYLTNSFARVTAKSAQEDGLQLWQDKLETAGLQLGLVGNICCAFLFFPVTRGSSLLPLVGLTSEASIRYHVWLGHVVMAMFTAHGLCYAVLWISTNNLSLMLEWSTDGVSIVAGEIALLAGFIMWATSFPYIRRKMFEVFFYSHQLYIIFLVFYLLHVGISFYCSILPGIYLFVVDRCLRFLQSRQSVKLVSARLLPSEAIELNFCKNPGFSYTPMSTVFINVPSISALQWHPFTVNSSSNFEPEILSVIIKKEGSWTQKLYQKLNQQSLDRLDVSVEGPYGPASVSFLRHDSLILVSGGSGITPFFSIIRELIYRSNTLDVPTPKILLICSFKTSSDLTMLDLLLPISNAASNLSKLQLKIEAFVTREKTPPPSDSQRIIRTLRFKPNRSDLPISPVLGPNGWLWLAAVISSSFLSFLFLLGILTRYYIYPIERAGNSYSVTTRALLNMLFMCTCIAAASSAAVLRNKKGMKQVQAVDGTTPTMSPSCWVDREPESIPQQSIAQATIVHYGRRPDLNEILLENEGSSIGVMASGPSQQRREVAAICSSRHADNLHFESISFSW